MVCNQNLWIFLGVQMMSGGMLKQRWHHPTCRYLWWIGGEQCGIRGKSARHWETSTFLAMVDLWRLSGNTMSSMPLLKHINWKIEKTLSETMHRNGTLAGHCIYCYFKTLDIGYNQIQWLLSRGVPIADMNVPIDARGHTTSAPRSEVKLQRWQWSWSTDWQHDMFK